MLDPLIHAALLILAVLSWGVSAWTVVRMGLQAHQVTPLDGFHNSIARWGYVGQARGEA